MNFANESSKILHNKYFLYFIVFLAASNVLGYLVSNKVNAVIFFALVAFLASNFSKNMVVILLVAIVATNLLMANRSMREGLENATMPTDEQKATAQDKKASAQATVDPDKLASVDHQLGSGLSTLKAAKNSDEANAMMKTNAQAKKSSVMEEEDMGDFEDMETKNIVDPNNRGTKRITEPETFKVKAHAATSNKKKAGFGNPKGGSSLRNAAPVNGNTRIDYATTLEDAYTNLDGILGSDGIGKLTNDTQRLMSQQQKLFDTMSNMVPMIETAKTMMDSLDMKELGGLTEMVKGIKK